MNTERLLAASLCLTLILSLVPLTCGIRDYIAATASLTPADVEAHLE